MGIIVLWYIPYYGVYLIMVYTLLWYIPYYGVFLIMVHSLL